MSSKPKPRPDAPMPPSQRAKAVDVDYILKMATSIGRGEKMVDLMTGLNKMRYANDNQVTDYLIKRGYTRTEEAFRKEIAGGPTKSEEDENKRLKPDKYVAAFEHLVKWVDNSLDLYKASPGNPSSASLSNTSFSSSWERFFGPFLSIRTLTWSSLNTNSVPNHSCYSTRNDSRTFGQTRSTV